MIPSYSIKFQITPPSIYTSIKVQYRYAIQGCDATVLNRIINASYKKVFKYFTLKFVSPIKFSNSGSPVINVAFLPIVNAAAKASA